MAPRHNSFPPLVEPRLTRCQNFPMSQEIALLDVPTCRLGESPVWDHRLSRLYWCDITGQRLHALDWLDRRHISWPMPDTIGSLGLTSDADTLVIALRNKVGLHHLPTGRFDLLTDVEADDPRTRLNDGKVGPDGAFWVGTMDDRPDRQPIASLYRITPDGALTRMVGELRTSNGLAWSPDGATLYHSDTRPGWIDCWDFDVATGDISNRRRFAQVVNGAGRPDGATMDAEGCYWSAGVSAGCLNRFAPDGSLIRTIPLPLPRPTMPCFCGPELDELVITSLRPETDAALLGAHPTSGGLMALTPSVKGLPSHLFRI